MDKPRQTPEKSTKSSVTDRIEEIYRVAVALFLERGYDNTPLSLIAEKLGLSKAGLYHHFESKEQLLFHIHKYAIETTLVPVLERAERERDPQIRLEQYIREFAEVMVHDPAIRVLIEESKRLSPENLKVIQAAWRRGFVLMRSTISELQAAGAGRNNLNPTIAAFAVIGMCSSTPYWFNPEGSLDIGDVGQHFVEIFCHGVLDDPPANEN